MTKEIRDIRAQEAAVRAKQVREHLNLSQRELGIELNISAATISELENGRLFLNFEYLYNINRKYGVNIYYVMFGEGAMFDVPESRLAQRLDALIKTNAEAARVLDYFEKSGIVRHNLSSRFISLMLQEKELIEKEIKANESAQT